MKRIPIAGPWITRKEVEYVADAAANAWYENANMYHERLERAFAQHLGVRFTMALPSCTSAIHLALAAIGIGPGDEVIVPECTWIATAAPISYLGATPVFADIDARSWCISTESFERAISRKTRAVIPVDLYGNVADMNAIGTIARSHGITVVEDAAEAVGAELNGRKAGSLGDVGVFSFHGSKTLTSGEGGLLATDDEALFRRAQILRDHGRGPGDVAFVNREIGFKYKMSSMQAAMALAQLERLPDLVERKRQIFGWYRDHLGSDSRLTLNAEIAGSSSAYWMVTAVWDAELGINKTRMGALLAEEGIDTRPFFYPLSSLPAFAEHSAARCYADENPVSYDISARAINLPSALCLTEEDVAFTAAAVQRIMADRVVDVLSAR